MLSQQISIAQNIFLALLKNDHIICNDDHTQMNVGREFSRVVLYILPLLRLNEIIQHFYDRHKNRFEKKMNRILSAGGRSRTDL